MLNKNSGLIIYIKKIKENDLFIRLLSKNDEIVTGVVYGGNSRKKKSIFQLGFFIDFNATLKNSNSVNSITAEIIQPYINNILNDKYKSCCLISIISLLNLSIYEGQKIIGMYSTVNFLINKMNTKKHWLTYFCEWLFSFLKLIGYQIEYDTNKHYKFFDLNDQKFTNNNNNNDLILFPHDLFDQSFVNYNNIQSIFLIFESIFKKNHLNNINYKMPSNFNTFKNIILKKLKNN